jgi:PhnB protein
MAYDVREEQTYDAGDRAFFVSVRGDDTEEISTLWGKLAQGSTVVRPLEPAQWAPLYGMLTDRFGVTWVLDVTAPYNG